MARSQHENLVIPILKYFLGLSPSVQNYKIQYIHTLVQKNSYSASLCSLVDWLKKGEILRHESV